MAKINTVLSLMYRDGANHKAHITVVLVGLITQAQIGQLKSCAQDGQFIIANQVGLPTPAAQFKEKVGFPSETLDHVWTTLLSEDVDIASGWHTSREPSSSSSDELITKTVDEFVAEMESAKDKWDISAEWIRLHSLLN